MFEKLVGHILSLPGEELSRVYLEDISICAAWFDSYRDAPTRLAPYKQFRSCLDRWVNTAVARGEETEGVRMQPLLRWLIAEVVQGRLDGLTRDQLDVIYFAWGLIERSGRSDVFDRPTKTLAPHIPKIRAARENLNVAPGLPNIAARHTIAFAEDLKSCAARDVKNFAGIDKPFRGPMLLAKGDLKIFGDVPDYAAVVADGGTCHIDGALHGHCAASESIEVYGNISGVAIARRGSIRTATLLNHSVSISKEASVECIAGEEPGIVFGARAISVRKWSAGGKWMGREIIVGGDMTGGEIHVSSLLKARGIRRSETRDTAIVLRRSLSCQDYGEVLTQDAAKSISAAMKLRQQAAHFAKLVELTQQEADDFAGGVLLFLLGEDDTRDRILKIQHRRRRTSFIERLEAGVQSMIATIEDRLSLSTGDDFATSALAKSGSGDSSRGLLEELERNLKEVENDGPIDRDCYLEKDELVTLGRNLSRRAVTDKRLYEILHELLCKEGLYSRQTRELAKEVARSEAALESAIGRTSIIERAREECARVEIMAQLVRAGKAKGGHDRIRRRVSDRFVNLMQRNVAQRLARTAEYKQSLEHCETRIRALRERLWTEHLISLPMHVLEEGLVDGTRAEATFEQGVVICAWKHLLADDFPGDSGIIRTPDSEGKPAIYERTARGTIEPR